MKKIVSGTCVLEPSFNNCKADVATAGKFFRRMTGLSETPETLRWWKSTWRECMWLCRAGPGSRGMNAAISFFLTHWDNYFFNCWECYTLIFDSLCCPLILSHEWGWMKSIWFYNFFLLKNNYLTLSTLVTPWLKHYSNLIMLYGLNDG